MVALLIFVLIYRKLSIKEASLTADTFSYGPKGNPKVICLNETESLTGRYIYARPAFWAIMVKAGNQVVMLRIGYRFLIGNIYIKISIIAPCCATC